MSGVQQALATTAVVVNEMCTRLRGALPLWHSAAALCAAAGPRPSS